MTLTVTIALLATTIVVLVPHLMPRSRFAQVQYGHQLLERKRRAESPSAPP